VNQEPQKLLQTKLLMDQFIEILFQIHHIRTILFEYFLDKFYRINQNPHHRYQIFDDFYKHELIGKFFCNDQE
jgi:hypothetical protein